jgi:hypothetical protein
MKKTFYLIFCIVSLLICSCVNEQVNIFSVSPAERLNNAMKADVDSLLHADNGWAMEYFATTGSAGYTLLVKFNKSGQAMIAGKSELTGNIMVTDSCMFEIIGDYGPVLTFNTFNKVLNAFSNPVSPDGYGLEGDYEFIVEKTTANQMVLKGKKRGTIILLNKIPQTTTWKKYFDDIDAMNAFLFTGSTNSINLISGADTLVAYNGSTHIFRVAKPGEDPKLLGNDHPFIVTNYGLRLQSIDSLNNYSFQNFKLSDDKKQLVSTENPAVHFSGPVLNKFLYSDLSLWKADGTQMSDNFKTAIKTLSDALIVKYLGKRNFEYIAVTNKANYANSIIIHVTGVDATYRILFSPVAGTTDRIMISLPIDNTNLYDNNGKKFYTEVLAIKTTLDAFCGEYVVSTELPLNVKTVKYTRVDNPAQFFIVNK